MYGKLLWTCHYTPFADSDGTFAPCVPVSRSLFLSTFVTDEEEQEERAVLTLKEGRDGSMGIALFLSF
jgi:hypothetical protein